MRSDSLQYYVREYYGFLNPVFCNELVSQFEADGRKFCGLITKDDKPTLDEEFKISEDLIISGLSGWADADKTLYDITDRVLKRYVEDVGEAGKFLNGSKDEPYMLRRYDQGRGFYNPHADAVSQSTSTRSLAVIAYLNNVEEGGETEFCNFDCSIKPEQGKFLLFPTDWMFAHQGKKPASGGKYIFRTFIRL